MTTKVCIASSRWQEIGNRCMSWAEANIPDGYELEDDPNECDVFISVLYGNLVSEEFISKRRCYNFHPGILPQYRGAGAFSWAIINGDKRCGVTLHELDVDIDTGPVLRVDEFSIEPWDTAETLFKKGMDTIYELFKKWFEFLLRDDCKGVVQSNVNAHTYYRKDLKAAQDLTRYVRAFTFGGKDKAFYTNSKGQRIELEW